MRTHRRPHRNRHALARLLGPGRRQRGVAEAAILYPFLVVLTLTGAQLGFYFHAGHVAQAAAAVGFSGAHGLNATPADGEALARQFLSSRAGELLDARVEIRQSATELTVSVTGRAAGIVPGWLWLDVAATYTGPVERWTE